MPKIKMPAHYIEAKTFQDFCCNQNELIKVLNHRTDTLEGHIIEIKENIIRMGVDNAWVKKLLWGIFSVLGIALISFLIKSGLGI